MGVAIDTHELPFPVFVGLLEDGEDGPPSNPIEADPKTIAWVLGLKQIKEHVHRSWMSQVRTDDLVCPDERPAVGMKLGGGYVKLGQELPLETSKGEAELDLLEHSGIDEAEGFTVAPLVISADGFSRRTRMNRHLVIVFLAERKVSLITFLEVEDVDVGVNGEGVTQQG